MVVRWFYFNILIVHLNIFYATAYKKILSKIHIPTDAETLKKKGTQTFSVTIFLKSPLVLFLIDSSVDYCWVSF